MRYMAQAFNIDHRKLETSPTEQQLVIRNYEDTKKFFFSFAKDHFKNALKLGTYLHYRTRLLSLPDKGSLRNIPVIYSKVLK